MLLTTAWKWIIVIVVFSILDKTMSSSDKSPLNDATVKKCLAEPFKKYFVLLLLYYQTMLVTTPRLSVKNYHHESMLKE